LRLDQRALSFAKRFSTYSEKSTRRKGERGVVDGWLSLSCNYKKQGSAMRSREARTKSKGNKIGR
jgi:hypothetical protein